MYQNRLFGGMPYYGSVKCFLNSITMITSYLSRKEQSEDLLFLCIWILTAAVSTSYAYHFDLKYDWGLLDPKYGYLRRKLIYNNRKLYYGIIVLNLLLRFAWTLNVSPDIIRRIPVKPYLIVMVLTSLEITRRGIWMIFRVEKEHVVV
jgi:xenotropic and polytropic retrovirus receptor 1